jgi:hypothetical protein
MRKTIILDIWDAFKDDHCAVEKNVHARDNYIWEFRREVLDEIFLVRRDLEL